MPERMVAAASGVHFAVIGAGRYPLQASMRTGMPAEPAPAVLARRAGGRTGIP